MGVWFCNCLLVSLGNGLILTGCSWLLRAVCSLHFQLSWRYWELRFGPAYVVFARSSGEAGLGFANCKGGFPFCWEALRWLLERDCLGLAFLLAAACRVLWIPLGCECKITVVLGGLK